MKLINKESIEKAKSIIDKLNVNITNSYIFFPIDVSIETEDEFGITNTKFKSETYFGNNFRMGIVHGCNINTNLNENADIYDTWFTSFGYAAGTDLISFDLASYMEFISKSHENLTDEEKDFISKFDCCLVDDNKVRISRI